VRRGDAAFPVTRELCAYSPATWPVEKVIRLLRVWGRTVEPDAEGRWLWLRKDWVWRSLERTGAPYYLDAEGRFVPPTAPGARWPQEHALQHVLGWSAIWALLKFAWTRCDRRCIDTRVKVSLGSCLTPVVVENEPLSPLAIFELLRGALRDPKRLLAHIDQAVVPLIREAETQPPMGADLIPSELKGRGLYRYVLRRRLWPGRFRGAISESDWHRENAAVLQNVLGPDLLAPKSPELAMERLAYLVITRACIFHWCDSLIDEIHRERWPKTEPYQHHYWGLDGFLAVVVPHALMLGLARSSRDLFCVECGESLTARHLRDISMLCDRCKANERTELWRWRERLRASYQSGGEVPYDLTFTRRGHADSWISAAARMAKQEKWHKDWISAYSRDPVYTLTDRIVLERTSDYLARQAEAARQGRRATTTANSLL